MITHSAHPLNAEPPLSRLRASFTTPSDDFYVRCHGDIPRIDAARHVLRVGGRVATPLILDMAALQAGFPHVTVAASMQCAGNRRADLQPVRATTGDPWDAGAIGNARWTGVRLGDLLRAAGTDDDPFLHVALEGADTIAMENEGRFHYGVSIPLPKALAGETLVAWAMNEGPLRPAHGFPLRVVVPGYAGVRSAKWLTTITVQDAPSANHMQQRDYKLFPPEIGPDTVDWATGLTIDAMPLTSAICEPAAGARLAAGPVCVRGYAIAGARPVARVDVSGDGGATWQRAALERATEAPWSWVFWQASLDLRAGDHELAVRAVDEGGATQPARAADIWNFKGYLCTAIHRVPVHVAPSGVAPA